MPFTRKYKNIEDVLRNTKKVDACLEWLGAIHRTGYPACSAYGLFKSQALHREVFRLATGKSPPVVMHACDNPRCINPAHLKEGTVQENVADMDAKERRASGARNGNAKFSDVEVQQMRNAWSEGTARKTICQTYGVSNGYLWKLAAAQYRSKKCKS